MKKKQILNENYDNEIFYAKIIKSGTSNYVLVPYKILQFTGLKLGDKVKVYLKKHND